MYEWTVGPSPAAICSHVVETWLLQQKQRCQLTSVDTNNRARRCCGLQLTERGPPSAEPVLIPADINATLTAPGWIRDFQNILLCGI
ncbi:hypothetical protein CRENBAI_015842 [Crenichthys baileyi]|uniref:Uncharacterized protein n=1 Tax=Crenichthys baileyi TaxID=28760 RepID=A0AAV9RA75_9TELE